MRVRVTLGTEYDAALWARNIVGSGAYICDFKAVSAACVGTKLEIVTLLHFIFHESELVIGQTNWRNLLNFILGQPLSAIHPRTL